MMIRIWIILGAVIALNGAHLAYDTINIKINSGAHNDEQSLWMLSYALVRSKLLPSTIHHTTSNSYLLSYYQNHWTLTDIDTVRETLKKFPNRNPDLNPKTLAQQIGWYHFHISLVVSLIIYQQYNQYKKRHDNTDDYIGDEIDARKSYTVNDAATDLEISVFKLLPLRTISRVWGYLNSIDLPVSVRKPILGAYVSTFGCDLSEAYIDDLTEYRNLSEFFRRSLKPGVRLIDTSNGVVSPSDGTVLYYGRANRGKVEQVKGITYKLSTFLGPQTWKSNLKQAHNPTLVEEEYQKNLLVHQNGETELYYCVIYLSPGDYHRFHSPTEWSVQFRRHFAGHLLSVSPKFVHGFRNLFAVNERVNYNGLWKYGFFSMTAVGATNVGSIKVYFDEQLATNRKLFTKCGSYDDLVLESGISCGRGEPFGEFNFGSTMVLIFEAPTRAAKFAPKIGQRIKYGQLLCEIDD